MIISTLFNSPVEAIRNQKFTKLTARMKPCSSVVVVDGTIFPLLKDGAIGLRHLPGRYTLRSLLRAMLKLKLITIDDMRKHLSWQNELEIEKSKKANRQQVEILMQRHGFKVSQRELNKIHKPGKKK